MSRITEQEWLAELVRMSAKSDDGLTTQEWCEKMKKGIEATTNMLKKAKKMGWLVLGKRSMEGLDGRTYIGNVYRIVKPKK